jgi:hypothetical protein
MALLFAVLLFHYSNCNAMFTIFVHFLPLLTPLVGMSFTKMFAANDWKPFQSCYCLVFSYLCKPVLESMFNFDIRKKIYNLYYDSIGCSARSHRSNRVPQRSCGRLCSGERNNCRILKHIFLKYNCKGLVK